jgi:TRAP-type C4-dicarboxylate transport system substrate-binding protein
MWSGINGAPYLAMNWDCWNELPADIQQVFEDNIEWLSEQFVLLTQAAEAEALDYIASAPDQELTVLSAEDLATFADIGWEKLLEEAANVDEMGLPGTEMVLKCRELIELYSD